MSQLADMRDTFRELRGYRPSEFGQRFFGLQFALDPQFADEL